MNRTFLSTTNVISNGSISQYYGVVSSHLVAGTGFFTDLVASVSDIVGGRSGVYREQLESLYEEALDTISEKAQLLGANGVIGLKVDLDNISSKGMSMFMITVVGTAVRIQFDTNNQPIDNTSTLSSAILVNEIEKRKIIASLNDNDQSLESAFNSRSREYVLKHPDNDYVLPICKRYLEAVADDTFVQNYLFSLFHEFMAKFIPLVDRDLVIDSLYSGLQLINSRYVIELITDNMLFDAKSIIRLVKEGHLKSALKVLGVEQPHYSESSLHDMQELLSILTSLPDVGKKEVVKGGVFSKDGEKYICAHGHKNGPNQEFCSECGENIKGITLLGVRAIDDFKMRVLVLEDLLKS